jgi:hypothetical protein
VAAGAAGLVAGGLLGGRGYGAIRRHFDRRFREELDGLLRAIAVDLATGGGFSGQPAEVPDSAETDGWLGA